MSYPSEVELCNLALNKIDEYSITDVNSTDNIPSLYRMHMPQVRRTLLREHAWNFAIKRAQLVASVDTNVFGYAYRWALPADYLQMITIYADSDATIEIDDYRVEGAGLLCDYSEVYCKYISDMTDTTEWSSDFVECAVLKLAMKLAVPLGSGDKVTLLIQELEQIVLPQAKLNNAWEDESGENNPTAKRLADSAYVQQNRTWT